MGNNWGALQSERKGGIAKVTTAWSCDRSLVCASVVFEGVNPNDRKHESGGEIYCGVEVHYGDAWSCVEEGG